MKVALLRLTRSCITSAVASSWLQSNCKFCFGFIFNNHRWSETEINLNENPINLFGFRGVCNWTNKFSGLSLALTMSRSLRWNLIYFPLGLSLKTNLSWKRCTPLYLYYNQIFKCINEKSNCLGLYTRNKACAFPSHNTTTRPGESSTPNFWMFSTVRN